MGHKNSTDSTNVFEFIDGMNVGRVDPDVCELVNANEGRPQRLEQRNIEIIWTVMYWGLRHLNQWIALDMLGLVNSYSLYSNVFLWRF